MNFNFLLTIIFIRERDKQKSPPKMMDFLSGWRDSNLRPSGPKPDALTGLRYTPRIYILKSGANIKLIL